MMVAPRSFAFITQRNPTGCASAIDEPSIKMQSALARSCCAVVAPPRPKEVPRPGTVLLCHIRAWLDTQTMPRPPEKLFDEIIFFVIQCRTPEMTYRRCVIDRNAVLLVHKRALARFPNTLDNHLHRPLERNFRPFFRARRAIFHFRFAP